MAIIHQSYNLQIANKKTYESLGAKLTINGDQITPNLNRDQLKSLAIMVNNKGEGLKISDVKEIKLVKN